MCYKDTQERDRVPTSGPDRTFIEEDKDRLKQLGTDQTSHYGFIPCPQRVSRTDEFVLLVFFCPCIRRSRYVHIVMSCEDVER
jgi:ferredoxin-thioredoxin reductase catalytic subunit